MGTLYDGDSLDCNAFFHEKDGTAAASQIKGFEDTWHWDTDAMRVFQQVTGGPGQVSDVLQASYTFLAENDMMAYLTMVAPRRVELR